MTIEHFPNPNNPRQRVAPVSQLVDPENPQRDGDVCPDDPSLSRTANMVRFMRRNEMYLPPNPWPEAMLLYGVSPEGSMTCAFVMLLTQFEVIPKDKLFGLCNPQTKRLYFGPMLTMPPSDEAAKALIDNWMGIIAADPGEFEKQHIYLDVNRWWVDKDEED